MASPDAKLLYAVIDFLIFKGYELGDLPTQDIILPIKGGGSLNINLLALETRVDNAS